MTTNHPISRRARAALSVALAAGVLVPVAAAAAPAAAATPTVACTSGKAGLAAKLSKDITAALKGRKSTTAIAVYDRTTNTRCDLRATQKFDSASVVKVTVLATLLWDAKKTNRLLTKKEVDLTTAMITKSDNAATSTLWKQLGLTKIKGFLKAAGMTQTTPGADGYWGLTQITARDEQQLLTLITAKNAVLSDNSRSYILGKMNKVVASQRWGVPAGAPATATVQLKNGWLSRSTHGWRVHSIGAFTGKGHNYMITVLTHDNKTMNDGVNTIQAVAKAVHKDLNPATTTAKTALHSVPSTPYEAVPATPEKAAREAVPATR
ncbi:serine hydrolase [Streptomyces liangshanensis]|uniref:Beta-lactamase n=1 Tax=Streptomyces liangshanensis TaxID=2717324 RepID=A0A6G9H356_9ACTN|nr:serine hydrolase [Streptomyces liangshanensis]QIQ04736.1 serine hydrolase [Streptomyces liangshanensis]